MSESKGQSTKKWVEIQQDSKEQKGPNPKTTKSR